VILLDSITRLARAITRWSGIGQGADRWCRRNALQRPKRYFGAARNIEEGGSLTIIATALIDTVRAWTTSSTRNQGTGNMEIHMERRLARKAVYPALNVNRSGHARRKLLLTGHPAKGVDPAQTDCTDGRDRGDGIPARQMKATRPTPNSSNDAARGLRLTPRLASEAGFARNGQIPIIRSFSVARRPGSQALMAVGLKEETMKPRDPPGIPAKSSSSTFPTTSASSTRSTARLRKDRLEGRQGIPGYKLETSADRIRFNTGAQTRIVETGRVEKFRQSSRQDEQVNAAAIKGPRRRPAEINPPRRQKRGSQGCSFLGGWLL